MYNEDPDTISAVVLHQFAKDKLGYLNVIWFAWSFDGEDFNGGIAYLESDVDCVYVSNMVVKEKRQSLHVYAEHAMDVPELSYERPSNHNEEEGSMEEVAFDEAESGSEFDEEYDNDSDMKEGQLSDDCDTDLETE